jgi:hypothetical protein
MFSTETQEQISTKYSQKAPLTVERKGELLFSLGIIAPPFLSVVPLMIRYFEGLPLVPIWIFMALGLSWQLIFYFGHKSTPFDQYQKMIEIEKQKRLLYDSFWHDLMRSGFGVYAFIALVWWLIEVSLSEEQLTTLIISLFFCAAFMVFCLIKREWLVIIAIDGLRKHKKVSKIVAVVMGIIVASQILGGIARMMRVTMGEAEARVLIMPIALSVLTILILSIYLMTFLGVLSTYSHYYQWKTTSSN